MDSDELYFMPQKRMFRPRRLIYFLLGATVGILFGCAATVVLSRSQKVRNLLGESWTMLGFEDSCSHEPNIPIKIYEKSCDTITALDRLSETGAGETNGTIVNEANSKQVARKPSRRHFKRKKHLRSRRRAKGFSKSIESEVDALLAENAADE